VSPHPQRFLNSFTKTRSPLFPIFNPRGKVKNPVIHGPSEDTAQMNAK
jgi:hypothetical protein